MLQFEKPQTNGPLKIEKGIPHRPSVHRRSVSIDWASLEEGDSVLVENEKRAMVVVSCFRNFKKHNPDKLVGMRTSWRKESADFEARRVHFIR